jgi:hypothetical protein
MRQEVSFDKRLCDSVMGIVAFEGCDKMFWNDVDIYKLMYKIIRNWTVLIEILEKPLQHVTTSSECNKDGSVWYNK